MLTNFIKDSDLQAQYTKIMSYLPSGQTTYAAKINLAFELTLNELRSRGIEPRRLHIPIDLNRSYDTSGVENILTQRTITADGNSEKYALGISGFRRFVVNVSGFDATSFTIKLQGSNDILQASELPTNWTDISTLTFTETTTKTVVSASEYKYYRLVWTLVEEDNEVIFSAGLYETCFDQLIIQKTFTLIYQEMSKDTNDIWYDYMRRADQTFESVLESIKFTFDINDDNIPQSDENNESAEVRFAR